MQFYASAPYNDQTRIFQDYTQIAVHRWSEMEKRKNIAQTQILDQK